jgi:hypothetical protein
MYDNYETNRMICQGISSTFLLLAKYPAHDLEQVRFFQAKRRPEQFTNGTGTKDDSWLCNTLLFLNDLITEFAMVIFHLNSY